MVDLSRCRATSGERNFIEQIKAPIFLEAVLAIDNVRAPIHYYHFLKKNLGFTSCKAEQPLQGMWYKKKKHKKMKHTENLLRKNLQLKDVC